MLKIAYDLLYKHDLEKNHKFPMIKYELIPEQLIKEKTCDSSSFFVPGDIDKNIVIETHDVNYYNRLCNLELNNKEIRAIGFPLSETLVKREKIIVQGTIETALFALKYGVGMNIAGGTHHAFSNKAEAFCLLNDQSIAANFLINNKFCKRILILDLDVHQGNGNSEIFQNDKNVLTFSMHCASNYPAKKSKSDIDIELTDNMEDNEYLDILNENLKKLNQSKYDFVFYIAGVDIHHNDRLGKLKITDEGINKRDQIVIENFYSKNIPLCGVLGGGYNNSFDKLIELHSMLHKNCAEYF